MAAVVVRFFVVVVVVVGMSFLLGVLRFFGFWSVVFVRLRVVNLWWLRGRRLRVFVG